MKRRMQKRQLKSLIESGHYRLDPALIAEAMLERRGVRYLLTQAPINPAGQTPPAPEAGRQAA